MNILLIGSVTIVSILIGTTVMGFLTGSVVFVEAQMDSSNAMTVSATDEFIDLLVKELIAVMAGGLLLAVGAIIRWARRQGVPITSEQEAMFKQIVTERFQMSAKRSWTTMRENIKKDPETLNKYWDELKTGHVPIEFQKILREEGKEFAVKLRSNKEFKDFAQKIQGKALDKLLENIRVRLKADYQIRMINTIPKLASIAVDAAFDENVRDVDTWSEKALEKIKSLIFSTEAVDKEENLMLIIQAEVNKRLQQRLSV